MDGNMYYLSLGVVLLIAGYFFRGGHIMLAFTTLLVGAWLVYSHEENIDLVDVKENLYKSIDEKAKSNYERKYKTERYEYNVSKVK